MLANIDYMAPNGAPDNDRKMKEASWLTGQAFVESLRYYPKGGSSGQRGADSEGTYSGCTHSARQPSAESIEADVRLRLGITPPDEDWREEQCPKEWFPEKRPAMLRHMAKVRERLKR